MPVDPLSSLLISSAASRILKLVDWDRVLHGLADDAAKNTVRSGAKRLFGRLQPSQQEKTGKIAIALFLHEWDGELEDKSPFAESLPGYRDQARRFIEYAAPEIVDWLKPETTEVDLGPVKRTWEELQRSADPKQKVDPLPEGFDWALVAQNYARAIRKHVKNDSELRAVLLTALQERSAEATERLAGPDPGFNLTGYRDYLRKRCGALQLAVMHTSAQAFDRQITLWSVFVPQTARESAPVLDVPDEIRRRLWLERQIADEEDVAAKELRERYQLAPLRPVLEILGRERLVVVLGNPGSGKTSLLKYLALRWTNDNEGPLPLFIDLREYIRERKGVPEYFETGSANYRLDARQLDKQLRDGNAVLFFDGLDEIFDPATRSSVVDEIAALTSRYAMARMVVTSRVLGYEPERLRPAGFLHATLEDFDDHQIRDFLARWHAIADDDPKERTCLQNRMDDAMRRSPAIRELAGNPLLLTMMAILNRNQELPRGRVELYREASRVLLHEWDARRALPDAEFAWQEKDKLLRELAGDMQQVPGALAGNLIERDCLIECFRTFLTGIGVQDSYKKSLALAQQLTERNFILSFAGADRFSFVHRTFLEYYCACWFVERFKDKQELTLEQLKTEVFGQHWQDEKWQEVLRLIAGMIHESKAEELILYLMSLDAGKSDKKNQRNLLLAAWCLGEIRNRSAVENTSRKLFQRLTKVAWESGAFDEDPYKMAIDRRAAFSAIAQVWRNEGAHDWLKSKAGPFGNRQEIAALEEVARGWKDDPETLLWLKDRLQSGRFIQVAVIHEVARGWPDDPATFPWLKEQVESKDWLVRRAAMEELLRGWKDDPYTLWRLKKAASSDPKHELRSAVVNILAQGWKNSSETLPLLMTLARSDPTEDVRISALWAVAREGKDDPGTLPLVKDLIRDPSYEMVRARAVTELAEGWPEHPETLPLLKEQARSGLGDQVRLSAIVELAERWKGHPDTFPLLQERARDEPGVAPRLYSIYYIARGWSTHPDTLPMLREACVHDSKDIRRMALLELARGWKDCADTLALVREHALSDPGWDLRRELVECIARTWPQHPETWSFLTERAISDADVNVCREAINELVRGWQKDLRLLPFLKERARLEPRWNVRVEALLGLKKHWPDDAEARALVAAWSKPLAAS